MLSAHGLDNGTVKGTSGLSNEAESPGGLDAEYQEDLGRKGSEHMGPRGAASFRGNTWMTSLPLSYVTDMRFRYSISFRRAPWRMLPALCPACRVPESPQSRRSLDL